MLVFQTPQQPAQYAPPQVVYPQPAPMSGAHATFDAAARFDGVSQPRIPVSTNVFYAFPETIHIMLLIKNL